MYHINYQRAQQVLEQFAEKELVDVLYALGGEFVDPDYDEDPLILAGEYNYKDGTEDFVFTRAKINEFGCVTIYGIPYDCSDNEVPLKYIEQGYRDEILYRISLTKENISMKRDERIKEILKEIEEALTLRS